MRLEERLRKFLLMRGCPVGEEFSEKEVREYIKVFFGEAKNERVRRVLIEDLLFMIIDHLAEGGE